MEKSSLTALAREKLEKARSTSSGRSAQTVYGGHEHVLRVALTPVEAHDLRARAIHCRSAARAAGPYIIGWQLAPDIPTARGITAIINRLTDVGSFQPHDTPPQPLSGDR